MKLFDEQIKTMMMMMKYTIQSTRFYLSCSFAAG